MSPSPAIFDPPAPPKAPPASKPRGEARENSADIPHPLRVHGDRTGVRTDLLIALALATLCAIVFASPWWAP